MHSKWQIWDFFNSYKKESLKTFEGTLVINTFDPFCLKMVKDFLMKGASDRRVHYKSAHEITKDWVEEEFVTLSLFGNTECFFIHEAHHLNPEVLEIILNLKLQERFLVLSFENENSQWKKVLKTPGCEILQLEAPRFWEMNKLLDFVCVYFKLPISFEAKAWMLDSIENDLGSFYSACSLLKINHPESFNVDLIQVQELLSVEKLDQFFLAQTYSRKKFSGFFEKILIYEGDFERMRMLFNFLQSHLIKIFDPTYLSKKPRLTQYDKDIQGCSKLWSRPELNQEILRFSHLEVMCKKKDPHLWHELKILYLRSLNSTGLQK